MAIKLLGGGGSAVWLGHTYHDRVYRPIWRNYPENSSSYPFGPLVAAYRPSLRGYARIPLSSGCSESAFSFRAGGPSRSHASLEVWPESHWLGFALRQPDVLQSYTTY